MAITAIAAVGGVSLNVAFTDKTGQSSNTTINVPDTATLAQVEAYALAALQALEALSDCLISGATVSIQYGVTGADPAVAAGNYAEDKGVFSFRTAAGKKSQISVPGIKEAVRVTGGRTIDTANADVTTFTGLIVTGDGVIAPVDTNGQDLDLLLSARIRQRSELGV
jgi:hypothetical protein